MEEVFLRNIIVGETKNSPTLHMSKGAYFTKPARRNNR